MDSIEAIMGRRSIRNYTAEPVTDAELDVLLRAAMAAPSAGNQQPWRFIVVRDADRRVELSTATPYAGMIARAPLALVICGDTREEKHPGYWVQDCSAAIQNLLVAAHATGLGAVWIGVYPVEERSENVRRICDVEAGVVPMSMIALGHPAEEKPPAERFEPAYVHSERWE
ncbi:MAG: nitroreductase family protein [Coriobacteriia bacterium]|nr:nitroreductase family protein [Coriobacteriia bacterium]